MSSVVREPTRRRPVHPLVSTVQQQGGKKMEQQDTPSARLPAIAFATLPATGETVAIMRGQSAPFRVGSRKSVEELNRLYGVDPAQQQAMLAGVLYGWDTPLADPDRYVRD
jgi:hypothetical protein